MIKRFKSYQLEAFKYMLKERHSALLMDPRLGKCLPTIRRIKLLTPLIPFSCTHNLIIAPNSALEGWENELREDGETDIVRLTGSSQKRLNLLTECHQWNLINKEGFLSIPEIANIIWDSVILDEAHWIRNPISKVLFSKFMVENFRNVPHRIALTGTYNANTDMDMFNILMFLDGSAYGYKNYYECRAKLFTMGLGYDYIANPGTQQLMKEYVANKCFLMKRTEAGIEPHEVITPRYIELSEQQRKIYDSTELNFEMDEHQTIWETVKYIWLRKLCGGFNIDNKPVHSEKVSELVHLLEGDLKNESVIVWVHFNHEIDYIYDTLRVNGITCTFINGTIPNDIREQRRRLFQKGLVRVIIMQQACANEGGDYSKADTAIYFNQNPSPTVAQQTKDRIVHIEKKTVLQYIYLICKNTVDEDIFISTQDRKINSHLSMTRALQFRQQRRLISNVA